MNDKSSKAPFNRITNPDGTPVRDQDNAQARPKPPSWSNHPAPNLAPPGMSGIRQSQRRNQAHSSYEKVPSGLSIVSRKDSNWIEGRILSMPGYSFHAKVFDEPSQFGIEGGMISKLEVRKDGERVINYDRGWDIDPVTPEQKEALYRIRKGLGDLPEKPFKGFDFGPDKDPGIDR